MDANGNMGYVEKPDWAFKKEYHKFLLRREVRARKIKEAEEAERKEIEAAAEKNHISPDTQRWVNEQNPYHDQVRREHLSRLSRRGQQIYESGIEIKVEDGTSVQRDPDDGRTPHADALIAKLSRPDERKLPLPSKETIKVGKWNVPKNYLDRYAGHVVKRIRGLIRMQCAGVVSIATLDPIGTYELEMERQELHNAICDAIGVPHSEIGKERTQDQADFDEALDKYLDKHAGSLFNGGGD